jgi:hypothetical protein
VISHLETVVTKLKLEIGQRFYNSRLAQFFSATIYKKIANFVALQTFSQVITISSYFTSWSVKFAIFSISAFFVISHFNYNLVMNCANPRNVGENPFGL